MTQSQALFIKWLRVKQEGTWRWVELMYRARYKYKLPYNELFHTDSNQLEGISLCDEAMIILNESPEDGWN